MDEIITRLRGWQIPLKDKALNNELVDVEAINVPDSINNHQDPGYDIENGALLPIKPLSSFAYATFLPPGLH